MTSTVFSRRRTASLLVLAGVIALLGACGQKGPLFLPGKQGSDTRTAPVATPQTGSVRATTADATEPAATATPPATE